MEPSELMRRRIMLGLTQRELAALFGVHPMTMNKWENGHHRIPEMARLALIGLEVERRAARNGEGRGATDRS